MKILIIGNGGREHALAWKAAQSPQVEQVFVAPGNAGTAHEPKVKNIPIAATSINELCDFAKKEKIDLTIVGPEGPLAAGIVDVFTQQKLACFGPTKTAAQLETSKAFCKQFLQQHQIPTASFATFSDVTKAQQYIQQKNFPLVIKADGLAGGKGVIIAQNKAEAEHAIQLLLKENKLSAEKKQIVIEEFLAGEEISFIVIVDGKHILPLATSQDHKTRDNHDEGPNTGGMGAYSPAPIATPELQQKILKEIIEPTVKGMATSGTPYTGFLYAGLMITSAGPKVLEFNCRLGDPETQPLMMRLQSDLITTLIAATQQKLNQINLQWDSRAALGVVLTAGGYPDSYNTGDVITGLRENLSTDWKIFHSGTAERNGQIVTAGGRVLCVTALGETVTAAQKLAYQIAQLIRWPHIHYRTDIGYRAIARETATAL